jgi:hypothetical protein
MSARASARSQASVRPRSGSGEGRRATKRR